MDWSCHASVCVSVCPSLTAAHGRYATRVAMLLQSALRKCGKPRTWRETAFAVRQKSQLSLSRRLVFALQGTRCAEQIKELILSSCEKSCGKSSVEQLDALFNDASKPVGFLLSERFINVPPQIALPMHQQLR